MQVARVAATPIVQAAWREGRRIAVHGWIYGLKDGLLRDLGVSRDGCRAPSFPIGKIATPCLDPTPVDDWSDHIRMSAIHLLETGHRCGCSDAQRPPKAAQSVREAVHT